MSRRFLPYGRQFIEADDMAAVAEVLGSDFLTTGAAVEAFEEALAGIVGARYAVSCSSGTAALHMAMAALQLDDEDMVAVPAVTFLATANAARFVGAEVRFVDVDGATGLSGSDHFEQALRQVPAGKRVGVLAPVHLAGQVADMPTLARLARARGLRIVEDAAHALGTTYLDEGGDVVTVGSCRHSDLAVFSFHPVKTIAMGEGGAVTTNDPQLYEALKRLRSHGTTQSPEAFQNRDLAFAADGRPNPWYYEMPALGFNYRSSDIHCALGQSQLRKLVQFTERRRALVDRYDRVLSGLAPSVRPLDRINGCQPAWHLYVALIDFFAIGLDRARVMRDLREHGIGTQVHYIPVHLQPYYQDRYGSQRLAGAERYYSQALSLPLFVGMRDADVDRVVEKLSEVIGAGK